LLIFLFVVVFKQNSIVDKKTPKAMMDIVREFPATSGAFDDLRTCLELTADYHGLVAALSEQVIMNREYKEQDRDGC
jgi:hypothetical protein